MLFVCVMIGTVTFDGLSQGEAWRSLSVELVDAGDGAGLGVDAAIKWPTRSACWRASRS